MIIEDSKVAPEILECDICLDEIPTSEGVSDEASDYVANYCGLDCYAKWRKQVSDN
ncbi:MAG: DUF3330 domain-containing protein [bacterium]